MITLPDDDNSFALSCLAVVVIPAQIHEGRVIIGMSAPPLFPYGSVVNNRDSFIIPARL